MKRCTNNKFILGYYTLNSDFIFDDVQIILRRKMNVIKSLIWSNNVKELPHLLLHFCSQNVLTSYC